MINDTILVTGGVGFIGSALCRKLIRETTNKVIILDKMTYASNMSSIDSILNNKRLSIFKGSIGNRDLVDEIFYKYNPKYIFNLAAETHVDNSIKDPLPFIQTNILETHSFIQNSLKYFLKNKHKNFRFLHISTDEVYGDISMQTPPVSETYAYNPSSPYSASKAAGDHLIKAYHRTYGFPGLISNCTNNYGPYQHSEKFIPVVINSILKNIKIPVYGNGKQIREWIYVDDHCEGLIQIIKYGKLGQNYNIGSDKSIENINLISIILSILKKLSVIDEDDINKHIKFVNDRPGHDKRYAINSEKIKIECKWHPKTSFEEGLELTINSILIDRREK